MNCCPLFLKSIKQNHSLALSLFSYTFSNANAKITNQHKLMKNSNLCSVPYSMVNFTFKISTLVPSWISTNMKRSLFYSKLMIVESFNDYDILTLIIRIQIHSKLVHYLDVDLSSCLLLGYFAWQSSVTSLSSPMLPSTSSSASHSAKSSELSSFNSLQGSFKRSMV